MYKHTYTKKTHHFVVPSSYPHFKQCRHKHVHAQNTQNTIQIQRHANTNTFTHVHMPLHMSACRASACIHGHCRTVYIYIYIYIYIQGWVIRRRRIIRCIVFITYLTIFQIAPYNTILGTKRSPYDPSLYIYLPATNLARVKCGCTSIMPKLLQGTSTLATCLQITTHSLR
jgi:hypothetical protein